MKIAKLLVLSTLWLSASSVMAAIVDGVRVKPAPAETQGFVVSETTDTYFYLYNVDAKGFFTEGNAWGTQVSIGNTGLKVAFTPEVGYDLTYLFNDFSVAKNSWKLTFFDNENAMFVDLGNQANYFWGVQDNGATFRLFASENGNPGWADTTDEDGNTVSHPAYREGMFMGLDAAAGGTACSPYLTEGEGHYINWAFVTPDVYNVYKAEVDKWTAAEKLRTLIDEVKAKGYTATADADAAYANEALSVAELEAAQKTLNEAFLEWGKNNASVENPADMTSKIVNAHFDNGDATTGWSGTGFGRGGTVSDGAEHYSKNYDTYQTITGLTPGVYAVGVNGYYRTGNYGGNAEANWLADNAASKYAKLYAKVGETTNEVAIANVMSGGQAEAQGVGDVASTYTDADGNEVTVYVPNTMAAGDHFFHKLNLYANKVFIAVDESGELTIGVKKSDMLDGDWSMFDDFSLTFYGSGADAYQMYIDEVMKNYSDVTLDEGTVYTEQYLTSYREALQGEHKASTQDEVDAQLEAIVGGYNALMKNIDLWKQWQADVTAANKDYVLNDAYSQLESIGPLADYTDDSVGEAVELLENRELTNEELEAEIAKIAQMVEDVKNEYTNVQTDGADVTSYITNPGFDSSNESEAKKGWTVDRIDGGNVTPGPLGAANEELMINALGQYNGCFESWHCHKWDIWQEVKNLPKGMYQLDVQGYVRCEVSGYNKGDEIMPDYPSPVYLYMNSAMSQFPSVYSESPDDLGHTMVEVENWYQEEVNGKHYPNSMGGAAQCFGWGMYKSTAYGLIAKKGDTFRIGVKMDKDQDWWCIFDNFKLTYREPTPEIVKPVLEEELTKLDLSRPMGSNVFEQASKVKEDAEAALASGDGEAMFDALVAVYDLGDAINNSVALFASLNDANEDLMMKITDSKAADATKTDARTLAGNVNNGIEGHTLADAEVEGLIADIKAMKVKLGMPAGYESASDAAPVEFAVIDNASYDEGLAGWSGTAAAWNGEAMNAEIFGKNYNYYQDIPGLPAGIYELNVQGFYRAGNATADYDTYQANPEENNNAYLYASCIVGTDTVTSSKPLTRLAAEAISEAEFGAPGEGYVYAKQPSAEGAGDGWFVPNNMVTAYYEFDVPRYTNNKVIVKLAEGATLRIGLEKNVDITDNWTIFDNWKLKYYGTNSALTPDGDTDGIAAIGTKATKVEFFNLNGARVGKPAKGVTILKRTFGDGSVQIQKVTIK